MGNTELKRLFTFGCSFTSYKWPTWADFIGSNYDEYQNWGASGAGNYYIASRVFECHQLHQITKNDTVLVMLSSFTRFDYVAPNSELIISGNVYSQQNINKEFLSTYWSEEYGFHITWFCLNSLINFLDRIGCKYKIMNAFDLSKKELDYHIFDGFNKPLMKYANEYVMMNTAENNLKSYAELKNSEEHIQYYNFDEWGVDNHPTIKMHHDWVKDEMSDFYTDDMLEKMNEWESLIDRNLKKTQDNFFPIIDKSKQINDFRKSFYNRK